MMQRASRCFVNKISSMHIISKFFPTIRQEFIRNLRYDIDVTLDVFGLEDIPKIEKLLPTHFPEVTADEKRSDTIFQLADGSILMLEYESNTRFIENHLKYIRYANRISLKYFLENLTIAKPLGDGLSCTYAG